MLRIPRIIAAGLLALGLALPATAGVGVRSVPIVLSPDGEADSNYPLGDKPPEAVELAWDEAGLSSDLVAMLDRTVGDAQGSVNLRARLSGTESPTSEIVLTQFTGGTSTDWFTPPSTGNNLLFDCDASPGAGSGDFKIRALYSGGGGVTTTSSYNWICNAAPADSGIGDEPGWWFQEQRSGTAVHANSATAQTYRCSHYATVFSGSAAEVFNGIAVQYYWSWLEPTQGNYTTAINYIKAEIDCLNNYDLDPGAGVRHPKLFIQWRDEKRNTTVATNILPSWLGSALYCWDAGDFDNCSWDLDDPTALAAHTAFWTNLINGLKADPDYWDQIGGFRPHQEMGSERFSSTRVSSTGYQTFQKEFATLLRTLAPDKMIWVNPTGASNKPQFLADMIAIDVLIGHGDMLPCRANGNTDDCGPDDGPDFNPSGVDRDLTGDTGRSCSGCTIDYRTVSNLVAAAEGSELGQCSFETYELQDIFDYVNDYMQAAYFFIDAGDFSGTGGSCDANDALHASSLSEIKAFAESNPVFDNTSTPAHYP
jgi:hypothetical protein